MAERLKLNRVSVDMFDRKFIVAFDDTGAPRSIKTRKAYAPGRPFEALFDAPYWHHSQGVGRPTSKPAKIISAARLKGHIPNEETCAAMQEARALMGRST